MNNVYMNTFMKKNEPFLYFLVFFSNVWLVATGYCDWPRNSKPYTYQN